jgi:hypothetical protein
MKIYVLLLMTILVMVGCHNAKTPASNQPDSLVKSDSLAKTADTNGPVEKLCFQNVHPYKNPPPGYEKAADYDQLKITIEGNRAYGIYNWLPYEKDARRGSFVGTIKNNVITATYVYTQEEIYTGIAIEILLTNNNARVTSKELGTLDIAKTACPNN